MSPETKSTLLDPVTPHNAVLVHRPELYLGLWMGVLNLSDLFW